MHARIAVVSFVLLAALPVQAETPSVAVMPLSTRSLDPNKVAILDNLVASAVSDLNQYKVISSNDIDAMLGFEKMKEAVGCDDLACAAEIGGALGVRYLLTGSADVLGNDLILTASLLDIQKQSAVARKRLRVPNDENNYFDAVEKLVAMTFGQPAGVSPASPPASFNGTGTARLEVTSELPGRILLDGQDTGKKTPAILSNLPAGEHKIVVEAPGKRGSATVQLDPGGRHEVRIAWSEETSGSIRVDAGVPGATVLLDGTARGPVPQLLKDVSSGKHTVEVRALGFVSWRSDVFLQADQALELRAELTARKAHNLSPRFVVRMFDWVPADCSWTDNPEDDCYDQTGLDVAGVAQYRWQHSDMFSVRLRVGASYEELPANDTVALFLGASEELQIPLVTEDQPSAALSRVPVALTAAVGAEALVSEPMLARAIVDFGLRLWWFTGELMLGYQFGSYADDPERGFHDTTTWTYEGLDYDPTGLVYGISGGLTFAF